MKIATKKMSVGLVIYQRMIAALRQVSFYASINHGDKAKDYGEIVNPVLKMLGESTGVL